MRITNSDVIRNREKELLEMISGDLDRDVMRKMLSAKYQMELDGDRLTCRGGELVVHDNQVAYQIEYEAVVTLSLRFNRQGICLEIVPSALGGNAGQPDGESPESGYYAYASTGKEGDEAVLEHGEYAYAATGDEADEDRSECGCYASASSGKETEDVIPEKGDYAAAVPGDAAGTNPPEERETRNAGPVDDPPATRAASSIAEMIAEINRT